MKRANGVLMMLLGFATISKAQANAGPSQTPVAAPALVADAQVESYLVKYATPSQETALRTQIKLIHPEVLPLRVFFLPHWKYLDAARSFQLHVPKGYGSLMFTHLPSRTIFVDNDRYQGEEWLGYWMAHELGHLKANSAKESDADRGARECRKLLEKARKTPR